MPREDDVVDSAEVLRKISDDLDLLLWIVKLAFEPQIQSAIARLEDHPVRKAIKQKLMEMGELTSAELQRQVVASLPGTGDRTVRTHIKLLYDFGLLEAKKDERDARASLYTMSRRWI